MAYGEGVYGEGVYGIGAAAPQRSSIITLDDIPSSIRAGIDAALLTLMVAGANARAARVAPCLVSTAPPPTPEQLAEARLVLLGAIKRWGEAGSGAFQAQTAGPFSVTTDTRQRGGFNLWPSEIEQLQDICGRTSSAAFTVDTAPGLMWNHLAWCAVAFGANWCSCGVDIAGEPIYELNGTP